jgi:hypothetical protein
MYYTQVYVLSYIALRERLDLRLGFRACPSTRPTIDKRRTLRACQVTKGNDLCELGQSLLPDSPTARDTSSPQNHGFHLRSLLPLLNTRPSHAR